MVPDMTKMTDQNYLKDHQYKTAANLQARIALQQRFSTNPYNWQRWVLDHLALRPGMRILEVGCGPASLWKANLDRLPAGMLGCLGDYSTGMLHDARQALADYPQFHFANLDAQRLPFPDAAFDLVIANHMLYHLPDIRLGLGELRRVLRPGGQFCAATNGEGHMAEVNALRQKFGSAGAAQFFRIFSLENGPQQVAEFFAQVQVVLYEDSLLVTEPGPLRAYVLSMLDAPGETSPQALADLDAALAQIFAEQDSFVIHKSSGIILAA